MNLTVNVISDSMVFYNFRLIYFKSEEEIDKPISNGLTKSGDTDSGYTYYFESSYFDSSKPLILVIEGIYALTKENSTIVIDTVIKKVIRDIDKNIKFKYIEERGDDYYLHFEGATDQTVGFSKYNGEYIKEVATRRLENPKEYTLKVEKKYVTGSIIEIEFWEYPNEVEFTTEITIID